MEQSTGRINIRTVLALAGLLLCLACQTTVQRPEIGIPKGTVPGRPVPVSLTVEPGSRSLLVSWSMTSEDGVAGYNIYVEPVASDGSVMEKSGPQPFNATVFPGDTDPDDPRQVFRADGLSNGTNYRIAVSSVYTDGKEQLGSESTQATPRPCGEFSLAVRGKGANDGYCFDQERPVDAHDTLNDLYFFSRDGIDYLNSPARQEGLLKGNTLVRLSVSGSVAAHRPPQGSIPAHATEEKVAVRKGDWVMIESPSHQFTLVQVRDITGEGEKRMFRAYFIESARAGIFSF